MNDPDSWESPQHILVVLAHPDDPEFFCGATIAHWTRAGHHVVYWLLTCGDKGSDDLSVTPNELPSNKLQPLSWASGRSISWITQMAI
jgi:LmbE family N-acetylglucosaminyl deacetylase